MDWIELEMTGAIESDPLPMSGEIPIPQSAGRGYAIEEVAESEATP